MDENLRVIAREISAMLARAMSKIPPEPMISNGSALVSEMVLAGSVAHFTVETLFGFPVTITVHRSGGMFGGA